MLATIIEVEVKEILESKGRAGWLRVGECAKLYARGNASKETKFYRWRKKVEKGKVKGFQVLVLPGNISFIGLESADPTTIRSIISENKGISKKVIDYGLEYMWKLYDKITALRLNPQRRYREDGTTYSYRNTFEICKAIRILAEMHPLAKEQVLNSIKNSANRPFSIDKPIGDYLGRLTTNELDQLIANLGRALDEISNSRQ